MAKILVIDDEPSVRKLLRKMLERGGHEVSDAYNGNTGIKEYRKNPADIVITDMIMPDKEGIETIITLKTEFPDVRIIAITGVNKVYLMMAKVFGVQHTFLKPINQKDLLEAVSELLT